MKFRILSLTCVLICVICSETILAATELWSKDIGIVSVFELKPDGVGGCAVVVSDPVGMKVLWFNKKGEKIVEKTVAGSVTLTAVTKKSIVYQVQAAETTQVQINNKAQETSISDAEYLIRSSTMMGIPIGPMADKKGFFVWKQKKSDGTIMLSCGNQQ